MGTIGSASPAPLAFGLVKKGTSCDRALDVVILQDTSASDVDLTFPSSEFSLVYMENPKGSTSTTTHPTHVSASTGQVTITFMVRWKPTTVGESASDGGPIKVTCTPNNQTLNVQLSGTCTRLGSLVAAASAVVVFLVTALALLIFWLSPLTWINRARIRALKKSDQLTRSSSRSVSKQAEIRYP